MRTHLCANMWPTKVVMYHLVALISLFSIVILYEVLIRKYIHTRLCNLMWNFFPCQIHFVPPGHNMGGCGHKGHAPARWTVQKQSELLHWPFVHLNNAENHTQETRRSLCSATLEKTHIFSFLGTKFPSLPWMAWQLHCSLLGVRDTIQCHVFSSVWQKFLEVAIVLRFSVSLVCACPIFSYIYHNTTCFSQHVWHQQVVYSSLQRICDLGCALSHFNSECFVVKLSCYSNME